MYRTPEGNTYPSATTVFGHFKRAQIAAWRNHVGHEEADRIRDEAAARGTKLHLLCETYLSNEAMHKTGVKDIIALDMFNQFKPLLDRHVGIVHGVEKMLYSDELGIAGTTDLVAEWDGRLSIIDFKSARRPKKVSMIDNYFEQTTAYACMWEERTGRPVGQIVILVAPIGSTPQVFIRPRRDYLHQMISKVQAFQRQHNLDVPSASRIADRMALAGAK
jgi:hypothetical protein